MSTIKINIPSKKFEEYKEESPNIIEIEGFIHDNHSKGDYLIVRESDSYGFLTGRTISFLVKEVRKEESKGVKTNIILTVKEII